MTERLPLTRHPADPLLYGGDGEYLEATSAEGLKAFCYVDAGTEAYAAMEEGGIVVIRAADGALLAETHPRRPV